MTNERDDTDDGDRRYVPEFQDVDVVPADLAHFAELLEEDRRVLMETWSSAVGDMAIAGSPNFSGERDGLYEGAEFLRAYWRTLGAQLELMMDTVRGLAVLEKGAARIHDEYVETDQGSAGAVGNAFPDYDRATVENVLGDGTDPAGGDQRE